MLDAKMRTSLAVAACLLLSGALAAARMSPRQIYLQKAPGVVLIVAAHKGSSSASAGTGSIIQPDGKVITNSHVVYDAESKAVYPVIHVFLKPDKLSGDMNKDLSRHFTAEVLAHDQQLDLALLQIKNPPADLTVMTLGDPGQLGPGDETIAIGHPEQGGLWTITRGVIGAEFENFKGVPGKHVFQMDTSLNRGNSGGPMFDVRGYQVGVNTAIARKGADGVAITGVNFALKASVVKRWVGQQGVALAYGTQPLREQRVAVADASPPAAEPAPPPATPEREPEPEAAVPGRHGQKTYRDPDGRGAITVGADPADEPGEEYVPARQEPPATAAGRRTKAKRRPLRFRTHYRLPPRPYTYRKLLTAVDKVRARSQDAFDDLEREMRRHGHRH
jgi:serine protease Do